MAQPVGAVGGYREQAPAQLVNPLGPGLVPSPAPLDAKLQGAVQAKLQVKEGLAHGGAPVAAEQSVTPLEEQRPCHRLLPVFRQGGHHTVGQRLAHLLEPAVVQVGRPPLAGAGVHVEGIERVPVPVCQLPAGEGAQAVAQIGGAAALLAGVLACPAAEGGQVVVEVSVPLVVPGELMGQARGGAHLPRGQRLLLLGAIEDVQ